MRQFLILFKKVSIDEPSVKAGTNSSEVVSICRCINVGLFISGSLRRDVIVSIAIGPLHDLRIISFSGEKLRRVSPDERSISFFLLKALTISKRLTFGKSESMDNGISIQRVSFKVFLESNDSRTIIFTESDGQKMHEFDSVYVDSILIYDTSRATLPMTSIALKIPRPQNPERFILDINMSVDRYRENP